MNRTGDTADDALEFAKKSAAASTTIEVLIEKYSGTFLPTQYTSNFVAKYGFTDGKRHYESIEKYFPQLVEKSKNLK